MRSLRPVLGLAVLAAVVAVAPAGAANTVTYQDSTGENPAAPDITTIVVSNNDTGMISFKINIPNRAQLTRDILVDILLDTDANPATGDPDLLGADYAIELFQGEVVLFKWDGTGLTRRPGDPPATSLIYSWAGGVTINISATPRNSASESSPCPESSSTRRPASLTSRMPFRTSPPQPAQAFIRTT